VRPPQSTTTRKLCSLTSSVVSLLVVFLISGGAAWASDADTRPTSLTFAVTDDKGKPAGQATITVLRGKQVLASGETNSAGMGSLAVPSPGGYQLRISKAGYVTSESALQLETEVTTQEVDVVLTEAHLSTQNVEVRATAVNPVTENNQSIQETLNPERAKQSVGKPATLKDTLPLIPGIVRGKDGTVRIAGYGESHSALLVNSVDVTDPATGAFGQSVPIDSVETISVSEMPYLAQYGRFTAGVVAAETRRGGDTWDFSLNDPMPEFRIRSWHLDGLKSATPRVNLSGPIIANRLHFLEGAEYAIKKESVETLPFPVNQTTTSGINSFTQVDAIISPSQILTASFHLAPHSQKFSGLDFFNPQPVTPNTSFHENTGTILDRLAFAGGVLQSTFAMTHVSSATASQGSAAMVLTPGGNQGNYFGQQARLASRLQWIESWTPRTLHFAGEHQLQLGSVVGHAENDGTFNARPVQLQDSSRHLVQRIEFGGGKPYVVSDTEPAFYLQDHWVITAHLALDAGFRGEAQTVTHTFRMAPRAGFAWSPDQSGKTIVRGGIGVFYDAVPLDVYAFGSYPLQTVTTYDSSGTVGGVQQFVNVTGQQLGEGFPFVDRSQKRGNFAPYSVAWKLAVDRVITRSLTIRLKYLQSQARDVITLQPEQVMNQNALVLGSSGVAQTRQFEFTAKIGAASNHQFAFSYVRQYARGNVSDAGSYLGELPFPVVHQLLTASLASEIPNRFLLWGVYSLPRKIQLMPRVEVRNGFPYQSTNVFQQYLSMSGRQSRYPRYFSADLRVSKDIEVSKKHAVRLSMSVLNLTNHFNPLEVHSNIADPLYGTFFGNYSRKFLMDFDFLH
jgi:TonB dependent receptor